VLALVRTRDSQARYIILLRCCVCASGSCARLRSGSCACARPSRSSTVDRCTPAAARSPRPAPRGPPRRAGSQPPRPSPGAVPPGGPAAAVPSRSARWCSVARSSRSARAPRRRPARRTRAAAAPPPPRAAIAVSSFAEPEQAAANPAKYHRLPARVPGGAAVQVTRVGHAVQDGSSGYWHAISYHDLTYKSTTLRLVPWVTGTRSGDLR